MPKIRFFTPDQPPNPPKKPKTAYRLTNWSAYNQALIQRGCLTLWFDEQTLAQWYHSGPRPPARPYRYSQACIECTLSLKYLLGLAFRQTQGLIASLLKAMKLDLQAPSYTQLCRRQAHLSPQVTPLKAPSADDQPIHVVVDSTGLKVYGEGEWKVRQHGTSQRRTWRKLHLAFDQATNEILATELTTNAVDDASMLKPLLEIVTQPVAMLGADGAYDRVKVYDELALRQIRPLIPPRVNARIWTDEAGHELAHARNEAIRTIETLGLAGWKQAVGYHRRSKAETGMYRWKTIFGGQLQSRLLANQQMEVQLKAACINRFNRLGLPKAVKRDST